MAKNTKDYFGMGGIVSLILAIIPITSFVCGVLTRIQEKHYICAILRIVLGWNIIWIADIVLMILHGRILRIA